MFVVVVVVVVTVTALSLVYVQWDLAFVVLVCTHNIYRCTVRHWPIIGRLIIGA